MGAGPRRCLVATKAVQCGGGEDCQELAGTACLELDEPASPKRDLLQSSFWHTADRAGSDQRGGGHVHLQGGRKLRAQQSVCKRLRVSIRTGMFNPDEAKYANGVLVELPYPTDDSRLLNKAAQEGLERVYREGYRYSKAEVLLLDLSQRGEVTGDLLRLPSP